MKGFFVTGTDTGVGKTVVAAALLVALRRRGWDAVPMKPVQTGCAAGGRAPDLAFALAAAALAPTAAERAWMAPYGYRPACSPHLAARLARRPIRLDVIERCARRLLARRQALVVEGAGGVLVPLNARTTMCDLMRRLGLPVVLVAGPGLGTLNHTALALAALAAAGLTVAGVVVTPSTAAPRGLIERDNLRTLRTLTPAPVLTLPFLDPLGPASLPRAARRLAPLLEPG